MRLLLFFCATAYVTSSVAASVDRNAALLRAVDADDAAIVKRLLREGADPKIANRYGVTPLSVACTNGDMAIVEVLLKSGADPNAALPGGETPLMTAARTGNGAVLKTLIAAGAKVDAKAHEQTALMWAAAEGNREAIEVLIAAGADVHARVPSGFTPMLYAVREGRIDATQALLKAGASVDEAIEPIKVEGSKLASGAGAPRAGTTALILAVCNGHYELASKLLDAGANPNAAGPGYTALHMVSQARKPGGGDNDPPPIGSGNMTSLEMVERLVKHGADLNARMTKRVNFGLTSLNTVGATPFFLASKTADVDLMRTLVRLGADTSIPNADHSTPLMAAAGLGTRSPGEDAGSAVEVVEALKLILEHGADIDAVDDKGETAMHGAAYKNEPAAVVFLAQKGANVAIWNQKNKHGWMPLTIARGYRFGNYKPSPETVAALVKVMSAAGVAIPPDEKPTSTN